MTCLAINQLITEARFSNPDVHKKVIAEILINLLIFNVNLKQTFFFSNVKKMLLQNLFYEGTCYPAEIDV